MFGSHTHECEARRHARTEDSVDRDGEKTVGRRDAHHGRLGLRLQLGDVAEHGLGRHGHASDSRHDERE